MTSIEAAELLGELTPAARKLFATMKPGVWDVVANMPGRARQHVELLHATGLVETSSGGGLAILSARGIELLDALAGRQFLDGAAGNPAP